MEIEYKEFFSTSDPVYQMIFFKLIGDHYENPFLKYNSFLTEELNKLQEGKMPIKDYNNYLKKGVSKILAEKNKKEKGSEKRKNLSSLIKNK